MKRIFLAVLAAAWPLAARADHGVDTVGMDKSVAPGDDFFAYANGTWLKQTEIPSDHAAWGAGGILAEETNKRLRQLLEEAGSAPGGDAKKVGDYYVTVMDEAAIEAKGLAVVNDDIARIAAVKDKKALAKLFGEDARDDVDPLNNTNFHTTRLFGLWFAPDLNAPDRYLPYIFQGGIGLPDREYYVNKDARMADLRAKYQAHVAIILKMVGVTDEVAKAQRIMALENKMAKVHAAREVSMDVLKANNTWKRSEFASRAPGLDWAGYFAAAGLDQAPTFIVWHPAATKALAALVATESLDTWKDWLTFHTVERYGTGMPKAFVEEEFAFYGHTLSGTPQLAERWKRALGATNGALGDAVGALYVKKYFPPEAKAQLQAMVKNIIAAFDKRIDKLDWMAPATRAMAKEKLKTLYVGVGYTDKFIDYGTLEIVRGDAVGNARRASLFEYKRNLAKLGKPVDTTEWCMTPQTVNAVNLPLQNALNFPAAFLQPPFFDPTAPAAVNYGSIGSVMGHEVSHSFDDQGAQFDAHGKLTDWWTKQDKAHFEAQGKALAKQYDAYAPFPDLHVNGKLTLSENIADVAGLAAAHDAWLMSLNGQSAPVVQGMTGEQQFFLAFAQAWRQKARDAVLRQQIITDGHSPDQYRAFTVRNLDPWYEAFGVKAGQALFLQPDQRVRVW